MTRSSSVLKHCLTRCTARMLTSFLKETTILKTSKTILRLSWLTTCKSPSKPTKLSKSGSPSLSGLAQPSWPRLRMLFTATCRLHHLPHQRKKANLLRSLLLKFPWTPWSSLSLPSLFRLSSSFLRCSAVRKFPHTSILPKLRPCSRNLAKRPRLTWWGLLSLSSYTCLSWKRLNHVLYPRPIRFSPPSRAPCHPSSTHCKKTLKTSSV